MRRLLAYVNRFVDRPVDFPLELVEYVKWLELKPGEHIPDEMIPDTFFFVEEGFLLLKKNWDDRWVCDRFYYEGRAVGFYTDPDGNLEEDNFRIFAAEPTKVYYVTKEDKRKIEDYFFEFMMVVEILRLRSKIRNMSLLTVFGFESKDRVDFIATYFPALLRVPVDDLADFLQLETISQRMALLAAQKERSERLGA